MIIFSNASIFNLGLQLVNILELIHDSGLVYNDLKPDNILLGFGLQLPDTSRNEHMDIFENIGLNLVDFGLATEW